MWTVVSCDKLQPRGAGHPGRCIRTPHFMCTCLHTCTCIYYIFVGRRIQCADTGIQEGRTCVGKLLTVGRHVPRVGTTKILRVFRLSSSGSVPLSLHFPKYRQLNAACMLAVKPLLGHSEATRPCDATNANLDSGVSICLFVHSILPAVAPREESQIQESQTPSLPSRYAKTEARMRNLLN